VLLRIGYLSTLYHTSHLLRHLGWLEQELGVDCRWHLFGTGPEMLKAFRKKRIDLGYLGLPPAILGISRGIPMVCVGGGHVEGSVMVAAGVRALSESGDMEDFLLQFAGRCVGTPAAGSIHDVILRSLLAGRAAGEVAVRNYAWADLIPYAYNKGEVSAAVGTPPLAVLCERECGTRILIPPEKLWPFNPSYGIVISQELRRRETLVEGFLQRHERACNLIRERPAEAARLTVRTLPGMDETFVRRVYAVSPWYCASLPERYIESALSFLPVMRSLGYLEKPLGEREIFDPAVIRAVHPEPHHYRRPFVDDRR
jgi:NitT/TauT family transport system substrate-binding protein